VEPVSLALLSLIPLAAAALWRKDRVVRLVGLSAFALLLAALRYQTALPNFDDPQFIANYNDRGWVTFEGVVRGYPDRRDTATLLSLDTEWIEVDGQVRHMQGTVLVYGPRLPEYGSGDRLRVRGKLETPPEDEDFSYRDYLANKNIHSVVFRPQTERVGTGEDGPFWAAIFALKDRASDGIARLIPDPEASLLQGILLGIRSGIPRDLYEDYNATGTSHIIVISGANITIVSALFAYLFGRLWGKRRAYWFTMAGILLYVLLVGADPVVVRAGLMGGLFVTALRLGRRATAYVSLLAAVVFLTALNPFALWDVGFQLSFAATLSLILFTPFIERTFERGLGGILSEERAQRWIQTLNDVLIVTLAAQVLVLPLVVYHFGRLSLVAPLANLLILPVQPTVMVLGGMATAAGLIPALEPLAQVIAWGPWLCLAYTNAVVRWMAGWPLASLQVGRAHAGWLVSAYCLFLGGVWFLARRREQARRLWKWKASQRSTKLVIGGALLAATLVWLAILQLPDGRLHVTFLNVGQGDAILITTPEGRQILVDGGPSPSALTSALGKEMPFWDRSIDLLVLTHPDADHITGLVKVLERYRVDGWLDNGLPDDDATYARCEELLDAASVSRHIARAGDRLDMGRELVLEVLHPATEPLAGSDASSNDNSVVLRLTWEQASFLLTGDLEAEGEQHLLHSGQSLPSSVLKVAHHGSGGSSTEEFLSVVDPDYAVISVGAGNRFGHPKQAVLDRLASVGDVTILRTDRQGTVEFVTDGQQLWIHTER
jgi:competence protein ComEC